jgi:hypothetical protein
MVGNGVSCATRVGDWDWAVALLAEWSTVDIPNAARLELDADQTVLDALRGLDPSERIAALEPMTTGLTDPQYGSYRWMAVAWAALAAGRLGDTATSARAAIEATGYFGAMALPLVARASLWAGKTEEIRQVLDEVAPLSRGAALSADTLTIRAGLAALEGRPTEALSFYRDALRAWQALGLQWDEALCSIDMAIVLDPSEPEARSAAEAARGILARLGAAPFLARLTTAMSRTSAAAGGQRTSEEMTAARSDIGVEA